MGWTDSHLHQFEKDAKYWGDPEHYEYDDIEIVDESRVPLAKVLQAEGETMLYTYDFGDDWRHEIVLDKIISSPDAGSARPVCRAGERRCPPEDIWSRRTAPHGWRCSART